MADKPKHGQPEQRWPAKGRTQPVSKGGTYNDGPKAGDVKVNDDSQKVKGN